MTQTTCLFMQLPAEIRNQIYELLLTRPDHKPSSHGRGLRIKEPLGLAPAVLALCRQIYQECSTLLYEGWFTAHPSLLTSMPFINDPHRPIKSPERSSLIQKFYIEVRLDTDPRWSEDDLAKAFSGIQELRIFAWQPSFNLVGPEVLSRFKKIRRVGKASVEGCGVGEEFSKWLVGLMESDDTPGMKEIETKPPPLMLWDDTWNLTQR